MEDEMRKDSVSYKLCSPITISVMHLNISPFGAMT